MSNDKKQRTKYSSGGFTKSKPSLPPEAAAVVTEILDKKMCKKCAKKYAGEVEDICQTYLCLKEKEPDFKNDNDLKAVAETAKTLLDAINRLGKHELHHILESGLPLPMETVKNIIECLTVVGPKKGPKTDTPGRYLIIELRDLYTRVKRKRPTRVTENITSTFSATQTSLDSILEVLDPYIRCGKCSGLLKELL